MEVDRLVADWLDRLSAQEAQLKADLSICVARMARLQQLQQGAPTPTPAPSQAVELDAQCVAAEDALRGLRGALAQMEEEVGWEGLLSG